MDISTFGLLSSLQLLCTLTHSPAVTNDGDSSGGPRGLQNLELTPGGHKGGYCIGWEEEKAMEIETDDED